ncbi:hypothetical protein [Pyrinomonas methylaliphatogenes]|jgi:hypothetical protein|uniref:Uncharacterized protein n=1 Tax=Pyrinomonas methylaliphatogenes TaxID=454194 RepID=A0A0B6WV14_9BACT|nr:hypothetical protein [Pyrinomonas methylaliphatogenes]MBX5478993.1 hypothetical protein [Pyrinomonas methylaliphatogenes]CDM64582.1 hypothetical protein PYK22_00576 [Pyrinomonas methylaliphatogenes]
MKRAILHGALSVIAALGLVVSAAQAQTAAKKAKPSAEHKAAVKKCNDDYKAALKEAKTKKGKERKDAIQAAKQARKQCIANAPA